MSAQPKSVKFRQVPALVRRRESGDTLIEVLLAVVIISLCVVAIMGALTTTLSSSGEHRSLAADETVLTSFAEQVKQRVELQGNWPGPTSPPVQTTPTDCPSGTLLAWYQSVANVPVPSPFTTSGPTYPVTLTDTPYSGYKVSIPSASEMSGSSTTTCSSATGIQEVTITVTAPTGVSDTATVIVRKQNNGSG